MATNIYYDYGNAAGPGPSYYKAFVGLRIAESTSTAYRLEWNHAIWVDSGDFYGTILNYSYWAANVEVGAGQVQLYGPGWYADNGWNNAGWFSSGQSIAVGTWGGYNNHNSNIDRSYTVPTLQTVPNNITNLTATKNSDAQITVGWTNNPTSSGPYSGVYLDKQTNGGSWTNVQSSLSTSYIDKAVTTNSKYRYRGIAYNGIGSANGGTHLYTGEIYTTPPAPSVYAIQNGTNVSCSADGSATRFLSNYEWQYSANNGSTWSNLAGTTNTISHSTSDASPAYRARVKNAGGIYSGWTVAIPSKNKQLFINIPTGASIKSIYIWK